MGGLGLPNYNSLYGMGTPGPAPFVPGQGLFGQGYASSIVGISRFMGPMAAGGGFYQDPFGGGSRMDTAQGQLAAYITSQARQYAPADGGMAQLQTFMQKIYGDTADGGASAKEMAALIAAGVDTNAGMMLLGVADSAIGRKGAMSSIPGFAQAYINSRVAGIAGTVASQGNVGFGIGRMPQPDDGFVGPRQTPRLLQTTYLAEMAGRFIEQDGGMQLAGLSPDRFMSTAGALSAMGFVNFQGLTRDASTLDEKKETAFINAALKDVASFMPAMAIMQSMEGDKSEAELISGLQTITGGAIGRLDISQVTQAAEKFKQVAKAAQMSYDALRDIVQQTVELGNRMGVDSTTSARIAVESVSGGQAVAQAVGLGTGAGLSSSGAFANRIAERSLQASGSIFSGRTSGLMRAIDKAGKREEIVAMAAGDGQYSSWAQAMLVGERGETTLAQTGELFITEAEALDRAEALGMGRALTRSQMRDPVLRRLAESQYDYGNSKVFSQFIEEIGGNGKLGEYGGTFREISNKLGLTSELSTTAARARFIELADKNDLAGISELLGVDEETLSGMYDGSGVISRMDFLVGKMKDIGIVGAGREPFRESRAQMNSKARVAIDMQKILGTDNVMANIFARAGDVASGDATFLGGVFGALGVTSLEELQETMASGGLDKIKAKYDAAGLAGDTRTQKNIRQHYGALFNKGKALDSLDDISNLITSRIDKQKDAGQITDNEAAIEKLLAKLDKLGNKVFEGLTEMLGMGIEQIESLAKHVAGVFRTTFEGISVNIDDGSEKDTNPNPNDAGGSDDPAPPG